MQSQQQPIKWCKDIIKIKSSLGLAWAGSKYLNRVRSDFIFSGG